MAPFCKKQSPSHRAADGGGEKPVIREKEECSGIARKEIKHKTGRPPAW